MEKDWGWGQWQRWFQTLVARLLGFSMFYLPESWIWALFFIPHPSGGQGPISYFLGVEGACDHTDTWVEGSTVPTRLNEAQDTTSWHSPSPTF